MSCPGAHDRRPRRNDVRRSVAAPPDRLEPTALEPSAAPATARRLCSAHRALITTSAGLRWIKPTCAARAESRPTTAAPTAQPDPTEASLTPRPSTAADARSRSTLRDGRVLACSTNRTPSGRPSHHPTATACSPASSSHPIERASRVFVISRSPALTGASRPIENQSTRQPRQRTREPPPTCHHVGSPVILTAGLIPCRPHPPCQGPGPPASLCARAALFRIPRCGISERRSGARPSRVPFCTSRDWTDFTPCSRRERRSTGYHS